MLIGQNKVQNSTQLYYKACQPGVIGSSIRFSGLSIFLYVYVVVERQHDGAMDREGLRRSPRGRIPGRDSCRQYRAGQREQNEGPVPLSLVTMETGPPQLCSLAQPGRWKNSTTNNSPIINKDKTRLLWSFVTTTAPRTIPFETS